MDFDAALADLDGRVPSKMVPGLERITALAEFLGDPQTSYPSVHITGTNGKTSVARMVTALFGALGLQVGTYTSPHLQDLRERLRVGGRPISREDFARIYGEVVRIAELVDAGHDGPVTYFEMLTALAYWWFAEYPVEVGVFEVGMGGTWDATNLVRGDVAAINTIDVDHPELGSSPGEVALEKAGIIKPGATVVTAAQPPAAMKVVAEAAAERGARLLRSGTTDPDDGAEAEADLDVVVENRRLAVGGQQLTLVTPSRRYTDVFLPLHGAHQADNAALALGALEAFFDGLDDVSDEVIREGFGAVRVPGRLEVVHRDPTVLLDGAHNPAGARRTATAVADEFAFRDVILVAACLADKDIAGILGGFRELASHVIVTQAPSDRAADVRTMRDAAERVWQGADIAVEQADAVDAAIDMAVGVAGGVDGVLVTGSLYTVGAARDLLAPFEEEAA